MIGTWYIAEPKHGAVQQFQTPFAAMSALLDTDGEADVWVQHADGPRRNLLHRDADGVWT